MRTATLIFIVMFGLVAFSNAVSASGNPLSPDFEIVVRCNDQVIAPDPEDLSGPIGKFENPCGFGDLVQTGQNIIDFLLAIAIFAAAVAFMWAGIKYMSAAGNQTKIDEAHAIFKNVAIGFILALGAWLIVYAITSALLDPDINASLLDTPIP